MALLEEEIVGGGCCVVLVGQQALPREISVIAQSDCLLEDIWINRDVVLSHQNALHGWVAVQPVKLMSANFIQSEPLVAGGQQPLQDVPGEG